jgi:ubiquitin C-terminal hydrolase
MTTTKTKKISLVPFDETYLVAPRGLPNKTFIHCYWNSTLQALQSCPQFMETIVDLSSIKKGTFVESFMSFINNEITNMDLYKEYLKALYHTGKPIQQLQELASNQQCVGETLTYFLEIFEKVPKVTRLFQHRYAHYLICSDCKDIKKSITTNIMFEVSPNNCLLKELHGNENIVEDYKCEKCNSTTKKINHSKLTMLPEILVVIIKQYSWEGGIGVKQTIISDYPEYISIGDLKYRAVAYINHQGRLDSGHYTSTCLRKDENGEEAWFSFNDEIVNKTTYSPNANTYMAVYSYIESIE